MLVADKEITKSIWFLVGQVDESGPNRCIPIHSSPYLIGRRADLGLCLPRRTVSTVHAELSINGNDVLVQDLNSTNGTYLNGRRISAPTTVQEEDLLQFADVPFRIRRQAANQQGRTVSEDVVDHALALVQFDKLMRDRAVVPYFQSIVDLENQRPIGYEVLGRSNLFGLESPHAMFQAASRLDLELELSRMLRWEGVRVGATVGALNHLFVNTHPMELSKPGLIDSLEAVRKIDDKLALTLEIHEAAVSNLAVMRELRAKLVDLSIGLAFDDFGAGQARLVELVEVRPDYLKFDMRMIRDIDQSSSQRQQMLASLVKMASELGCLTLAEGIETLGEHDVCQELGFKLAQGFLYGKPAPSHFFQNEPAILSAR